MKKQIILFAVLFAVSISGYGQKDSIHQEVFPSLGKFALLTSDGSLYDNVVHGSLEFIESQKPIELNKALQRRKTIFIIKTKCHE